MERDRAPSVLPGLRAHAGVHALLPVRCIVLVPLVTLPLQRADAELERALARPSSDPRVVASLQAELGACARRGDRQRRVRPDRRVGARALRFPGQAHRRRPRRPAVRAADGGRGHRADDALRAERLARRAARAARHQGRVHAARASSSRSIFIGLPFVVRTRAAGARGSRRRGRGSGGQPRREPLADVLRA